MYYTGVVPVDPKVSQENGQCKAMRMPSCTNCYTMYLGDMIFTIFCLYFIHFEIGYECIVFSCIVKINLLLLFTQLRMSFIFCQRLINIDQHSIL